MNSLKDFAQKIGSSVQPINMLSLGQMLNLPRPISLKAICNTPTELSFTYPAKFFGSGGTYAYVDSLSLTLKIDGSYVFSGGYTNRGDVPGFTAPSQDFAVSLAVTGATSKTTLKGIPFVHKGSSIPSAPQNGSHVVWNTVGNNPLIKQYWSIIALHPIAWYHWDNTTNLGSLIDGIGKAISGLIDDIKNIYAEAEKIVGAAEVAVEFFATIFC
jgi:hypothetical protein